MILRKLHRIGPLCLRSRYVRNLASAGEKILPIMCKHLNINENQAQYLCLKHPVIKKLKESEVRSLIDTVLDLGFSKEILLEEPLIFSMLPVTLKFRFMVLQECGIEKISSTHLVSYLRLVKTKTIGELKRSGEIPNITNVENRLASYMTQWPTSLTTLVYGDVNEWTLYTLRLKIIQRYLELVLDLTEEEFHRGIQTYPTVRHRPLQVVNETLTILQSLIMMPTHKIKNNLYLVHTDPDNLKQILYKFRSIGGIDMKEVLRMHPKLATKNYHTLVEIRKLLQEYNITSEAQIRCFEIYTLGPSTIRERLEQAKTIPEFNTFYAHPRFLKMIHYKNTAMKRLMKLYSNNKKCLSLNILSGSSAHYDIFEKAPGDRLGKGKDLVFCITQSLGNSYSMNHVRNVIKRHPFWIHIPLVQVKFVCQQLSAEFSPHDIYQNCPILLYPWSKIKKILIMFSKKQAPNQVHWLQEHVDLDKLNKSQKLSLVLYLLERNHYFTGNGVWTEEKNRNIDLENSKEVKVSSTS